MTPLQEQLRMYAPWLFEERHFDVTAESYDPKAFGNSEVVLQSSEAKIRVVRDRGQIFVQFEPPSEPGVWLDLSFLLEAIHGTASQPTFDLDGVLSLLRENIDSVIRALNTDWCRTKEVLDRRRRERLQALRAISTRPGRAVN